MSGFTKLVPEIVQSSIWNEPSDIRIVWITMLAVKDENGYVQGDARTIARLANVSQDASVAALDMFQKPDPYSHTPDDDGKRITAAPGGWIVLNHEKYRIRDHRAEHAAYVREWRKNRDMKKCDSQMNHPSASASASASEEDKSQREGTKFFEAFDQLIPEQLRDQRFVDQWHSWVQDRKARKRPITHHAAILQLAKLKAFGVEKAIRALGSAIERGWTGLFDPDERGQASKPARQQLPQFDAAMTK